jgi:hypothetical protein
MTFLEQWLRDHGDAKRRGQDRRTVVMVAHDDDCPCGMLSLGCECDPEFIFKLVEPGREGTKR